MSEGLVLGSAADPWARRAILALTLVLSCVIGLITPYLLAVIGIVLWLALVFRRQLFAAYDDLAARLFLLAFVVLAACFAVTAKVPQDALFSLNFIMLVLFAPLRTLLARGTTTSNAARVADLALAGALVAFLAAGIGRYGFDFNRAESPIFGAILLGNTAVLLGFLAAIGVIVAPTRKWLYAAAPLLGVATAALTASRGPMLAIAPLVILGAVVFARRFRISPLHAILATAGYLALCVLLLLGLDERPSSIVGIAGEVASGGEVADTTAGIRLALYEAGFRAFLDAPILGHGWARLMSSAIPYLSEEMRTYGETLPQLHNDVINFAVAAGVVGVAVYLLLIATPIVAALRSPRDSQYSARLFGCFILCIAYVFDGLTDLMFGFEFHTALYIALTAILLAFCRDPVAAENK